MMSWRKARLLLFVLLFGIVYQLIEATFEVKGVGKWQVMVDEKKLVVDMDLGDKDSYKPEKQFTLSVGGCPVVIVASPSQEKIIFRIGDFSIIEPKSFTASDSGLSFPRENDKPAEIPCSYFPIKFEKSNGGNFSVELELSGDVSSGWVLKPHGEETKKEEANAFPWIIAGPVIGGVIILFAVGGIVGFVIWWFCCRKKKSNAEVAVEVHPADNAGQEITPSSLTPMDVKKANDEGKTRKSKSGTLHVKMVNKGTGSTTDDGSKRKTKNPKSVDEPKSVDKPLVEKKTSVDEPVDKKKKKKKSKAKDKTGELELVTATDDPIDEKQKSADKPVVDQMKTGVEANTEELRALAKEEFDKMEKHQKIRFWRHKDGSKIAETHWVDKNDNYLDPILYGLPANYGLPPFDYPSEDVVCLWED